MQVSIDTWSSQQRAKLLIVLPISLTHVVGNGLMHIQMSYEKCRDPFNASKARQRAVATPWPVSAQRDQIFGVRVTVYLDRLILIGSGTWLTRGVGLLELGPS